MVQDNAYCVGPDIVRFRARWDLFERVGLADGTGGAQYFRALWAWIDAGRPGAVGIWLQAWLAKDDNTPNPEVL